MTTLGTVTQMMEKRVSKGSSQKFWNPYPRPNSLILSDEMTKFSMITRGVSHALSWGGGLQRHPPHKKSFGTSTCAHTVWETTTKFCTAIKVDARKFFYRVDHHECWPAICLR